MTQIFKIEKNGYHIFRFCTLKLVYMVIFNYTWPRTIKYFILSHFQLPPFPASLRKPRPTPSGKIGHAWAWPSQCVTLGFFLSSWMSTCKKSKWHINSRNRFFPYVVFRRMIEDHEFFHFTQKKKKYTNDFDFCQKPQNNKFLGHFGPFLTKFWQTEFFTKNQAVTLVFMNPILIKVGNGRTDGLAWIHRTILPFRKWWSKNKLFIALPIQIKLVNTI